MKAKSELFRKATSYLFVMFILGETFVAASPAVNVPDKTIATKRARNMSIVLTNDTGKLTRGENHFCVLFQGGNPTSVSNIQGVSVDFRLLVGRLQEEPTTAHLRQNGVNRYCGDITLGSKYYQPSSYYAFVHYVEATGKKKSARLHVTVK
ncbi:hypothetical protein [Acidicapsa ligni]|uniref:hypothetical protein n=1 Tax=Acidicapsa ligni TaxID=542300 RepID=UPI0021DFC8C5|nr:hypothetical protein [Acidicapsa ligni]